MLTVFNMIRFGAALAEWDLLLRFMPRPGPIYIAATGLFWALGLLGVALSLWFGWKWARPTSATLIALYISYYWIDRLFFQSAVGRKNQYFALVLTFSILIFTALTLFLPGSRKFFKKRE